MPFHLGSESRIILPLVLAVIALLLLLLQKRRDRTAELTEINRELKRLAALIEYSRDAIVGLTENGIITSWNKGAAKTFGFLPEEIIGKDFSSLLGPEHQRNFDALLASFKSGKEIEFLEAQALRKDQTSIYLSLALSTVRDAQEKIAAISCVARDITSSKETEVALREAERLLQEKARELERSNKELEHFAYIASHDLQEPLRQVSNFCQLLQLRYENAFDEEGRGYLHYVVDGAARLQTLVSDLLKYSLVGRTKGQDVGAVESEVALKRAIADLQLHIEESGAIISHEQLPTVRAEESQLAQLFQNLLGNAIKYRSERPLTVQVAAKDTGDTWLFSVSDNGIGFKQEYAERIFEMFKRLHARSKYPGTGIGLALCRKIVEQHGGRIWTESEEARGSNFYFTLPK